MNKQEITEFISKNIKYKNWDFVVGEKGDDCFYVQIQFVAPCHISGNPEVQYCRKWQLSKWMTPTELVRTCFLAVLQAERHETEEEFTFKGRDIFNSHINVESLVKVCENGDYEHRGDPIMPIIGKATNSPSGNGKVVFRKDILPPEDEGTVEGTLAAMKVIVENFPRSKTTRKL